MRARRRRRAGEGERVVESGEDHGGKRRRRLKRVLEGKADINHDRLEPAIANPGFWVWFVFSLSVP